MATDLTRFESVTKIPAKLIFAKSEDEKTVVLVDGTRVTDELIAEAKKAARDVQKGEAGQGNVGMPEKGRG